MKSVFKWTIIVISAFCICGCTKSGDDVTVQKWYYSNGNLKKVQEYLHDTIEHGTYLFYNENGILIDSAQIVNDKFHGKRYLYYDNGILRKITTYKNDVYRSGLDFDFNGNLEYYSAYNYNQDLKFLVKFDSTGSIIKYEGEPIYSWVLEEQYPVNEIFSVELLVPNIPNHETKVIINDLYETTKEKRSSKVYRPDKFNRIVYSKLRIPSEMQILNSLTISNKNDEIIITDTLVFKISKTGHTSYSRSLHN